MIRPVLQFPDRRLKSLAVPIRKIGPEAHRLADDLRDTARAHEHTVGLAAPQIGAMWRMIYVDLTGHPKAPDDVAPMVMINPVVTHHEGREEGREGCLSLPDITARVARATSITVEALDLDARPFTVAAEGFHARVILHEIDHLDGVLILDRVSSLARDIHPRIRPDTHGLSRAQARVVRARTLARVAHSGQFYGDGPYTDHLDQVVELLTVSGVNDPGILAAAWLHDVVEDTPVASQDLVKDFGARVAALVEALTVYDGDHEDSWRRIAQEPGAVAIKLADRTVNVRNGGVKVARYREQQPGFRAILADADNGVVPAATITAMWRVLEETLASAS